MITLDTIFNLTFDDFDEWLELTPTFVVLELYVAIVELILIGTIKLYQYIGIIQNIG